jgi:S-adenosylmethionine synthetase
MIFTSESVTKGHPDKICDRVSDTLLDEALRQDPKSKVALDTWVKDNNVGVIGEITTQADIDYEALVRQAIAEIGYSDPELGFDADSAAVHLHIGAQSPEINTAVVKSDEEVGAGDQGIMFGYASNDTEELMPLPIMLAHKLARQLEDYRENQAQENDFTLRPDGKTQVSVAFDEKLRPQAIDTILISTQHSPDISQDDLRELLIEEIIKPVLDDSHVTDLGRDMKILTNPSGSFVVGGPVADSGLTGRKNCSRRVWWKRSRWWRCILW